MEQFILQNLTPAERKEQLEKHASTIERITYTRHLTDAEIEQEAKNLADTVIKRTDVEEEKKDVMKGYNERIQNLKTKAEQISDTLMRGTKEECSACYKFINLDTKEVGYYNELGELVKIRPAMDADMQLDMFAGQKMEQEDAKALEAKQAAALPAGDKHPDAEEVPFEEVADDQDPEEKHFEKFEND